MNICPFLFTILFNSYTFIHFYGESFFIYSLHFPSKSPPNPLFSPIFCAKMAQKCATSVPQVFVFFYIITFEYQLLTICQQLNLVIGDKNDKVKPAHDKNGKAGETFAPPVKLNMCAGSSTPLDARLYYITLSSLCQDSPCIF